MFLNSADFEVSIVFFSHNVFSPDQLLISWLVICNLLSAASFNLDQSKILSSYNGVEMINFNEHQV